MTNHSMQGVSSKEHVKAVFIRCLDCDKYHDLTCDIAIASETTMSTENFQRFVEFLIEHNGHRFSARAETVGEEIL